MGTIFSGQANRRPDPHGDVLRGEPGLRRDVFPRGDGFTFSLSDGRKMGYAEYGDLDADPSRTLLFLHGTPGTRFFWHARHSMEAERAGVRVIVPERPGFGLSTPHSGRTLLSHADDLAELMDHLRLSTAVVLAFSAGGPYALAAAFRLRERVRKVVIVASLSPPFVGSPGSVTEGMATMSRVAYFLCRKVPFALRWAVRLMAKQNLRNVFEPERDELQEEENAVFRNDIALRRLMAMSTLELYSRECGFAAETEDYLLFGRDWGFDLAQLPESVPLFVYGGMIDDKTTPNMWNLIVKRCPNIAKQSHLQPGKGHLYFYELFPNILKDIGFVRS